MANLIPLFDPCALACPRQRTRNRELAAEAAKLVAPLDTLGLSTRPRNILRALGCKTVADVVDKGRRQIEDAPRAGRIHTDEIQAAVERLGLTLPLEPAQELF